MAVHYGSKVANALIMGGTSFSFPTAPATQGDALAFHVASNALLPTSRAWGIGTTSTAGITLANTTAATAGATVQRPPALQMDGTAWSSGGGVSATERWRIECLPATAATATSSLVLSRAQDAGAFATVASFTSGALFNCGSVSASGGYTAASSAVFEVNVNRSFGLGAATNIFKYAGDTPFAIANSARGDAASNIVHATVFDRNAASITNAATMRLWSGGWTNNADAYTELGALYCDGRFWAASMTASGDPGGLASCNTFTGATVAAGSGNDPTHIKVPGSAAAAQVGWLKIYVGTTAYVIPYWGAA